MFDQRTPLRDVVGNCALWFLVGMLHATAISILLFLTWGMASYIARDWDRARASEEMSCLTEAEQGTARGRDFIYWAKENTRRRLEGDCQGGDND